MVERLAAAGGGRDRHRELVLDRLLADEVLQPAGAQRAVELVVGQLLGILDPRRLDSARLIARGAHRGRPQRVGDQVLGRVAVGAVEQLVDLGGAVAEPEQALAGERRAGRRRG